MNPNPFTMTFGIEPKLPVARAKEAKELVDNFTSSEPSNYVYLITGPRGSGKTVLLSAVSNALSKRGDWIAIDPGAKDNLLENIASEIYETTNAKKIFLKGEFSFSFHGITFALKGKEVALTPQSLIKKMVRCLNEKGKGVLITIDEVDNSQEMKYFVQTYESLIRQNCKIALLMTGLYENISKLQDDKALTFLYRAPKIFLSPLNINAIALNYKTHLGVSENKALELAKFTHGYAYAYQTLGYLLYQNNLKDLTPEILCLFDQYMADYVYDKILSEASDNEQKILFSFKGNESFKVEELRKEGGWDSKAFSVYRDRLIKKGILESPKYGYLRFVLPRFYEYLITKSE